MDAQVLRAQHDVTIGAMKEGHSAPRFVALFVAPGEANVAAQRVRIEIERVEQRGRAEERAGRLVGRGTGPGRSAGGGLRFG
jgi:hypothetical protein